MPLDAIVIGLGAMGAAATAEILADLLEHGGTVHDIGLFRPGRFLLE